MVANTDQKLRMFELWASISDLVIRGKRDPEQVSKVLQFIKDEPEFYPLFFGGGPIWDTDSETEKQLYDWQRFYKETFNLQKDFFNLRIPEPSPGSPWLIAMAEGLTARKIVNEMRNHMDVSVWDDGYLDTVESVRKPDKDYVLWVRDRIEADEELKNLSADDLKQRGINCLTLEERLMLEFFYWWKTKKHLDIKNATLCAGSRYSDGGVPRVFWNPCDREVRVYWGDAAYQFEDLRGRMAVS